MIAYREARAILESVAAGRRLAIDELGLVDAFGCVLSEDLRSREAVPSFDNSAMDGFAVRSASTAGASKETPVLFGVGGFVAAGDSRKGFDESKGACAVEIMTGAPMPGAGFDSVAKVEDVEVTRDPSGAAVSIAIRRPISKWENVRRRGEDFLVGQPLAGPGQEITPELVLALATLGVDRLKVRRKARIALISTGKELVHHSEPRLGPGMIRNSTAPYLLAAAAACGAECRHYGTVGDEPGAFLPVFERAVTDGHDIILTTGAVSMGKHDFVRDALESVGAKILFHKTAIRPGKPILFAEHPEGPVVFGLPGNPVSTSVGMRFFVAPYIRGLRGMAPEEPLFAKAGNHFRKPPGLRSFFKARVSLKPEGAVVEILSGQASFMVSPLLRANAWAELLEEGSEVREGDGVRVYPMYSPSHPWSEGVARDGESSVHAKEPGKEDRCCV